MDRHRLDLESRGDREGPLRRQLSTKAIHLLGALSKKEIAADLARLSRLRKRLLQECADSPRSSTPISPRIGEIPKAIIEVLAETAEPMHVSEIHRATERLLDRPVNYRSVKSCLSADTQKERPRFKRTAHGCYRLT
jgi:hypothetical protein